MLLGKILCSSCSVRGDWAAGAAAEELLGRQRPSRAIWKRLRLLPFLLHLFLVSFWSAVTAGSFLLAVSSCAGAHPGNSRVWNKGLQSLCWLWQSSLISFSVPSGAAKHAIKSSPSRCHHWIGKRIFSSFHSSFEFIIYNNLTGLATFRINFVLLSQMVSAFPPRMNGNNFLNTTGWLFFPFLHWIYILPWHTACWLCSFPKPF